MNRLFLIFITPFFIINLSYTQVIKTYNGSYSCDICEYKEDYYSEKATYTYYENEKNERIYNGKFTYSALVNAHFNNLYYLISIETNYTNGAINGKWSYSKKIKTENIKQQYIKYMGKKIKLNVKLVTPQTIIKGEFNDGYKVNDWEVITYRNNVIEENFKASFNKKGNLVSNYNFISNNVSIIGEFDNNNL